MKFLLAAIAMLAVPISNADANGCSRQSFHSVQSFQSVVEVPLIQQTIIDIPLIQQTIIDVPIVQQTVFEVPILFETISRRRRVQGFSSHGYGFRDDFVDDVDVDVNIDIDIDSFSGRSGHSGFSRGGFGTARRVGRRGARRRIFRRNQFSVN
ncbi:MAG: hypothetical protein ACC645_23265 [Pirellulales bacterium]